MSVSSTAPASGALVMSRWPWLAPSLLFLVFLLLYSIGLDDGLAVHDEIHHILAAQGLIATGEPRIAEGLYTRGYVYTWMVAQSYWICRLQAVLPMRKAKRSLQVVNCSMMLTQL